MIGGSLLHNLFGTRYTLGELMQIDQGRQQRAAGCSVSLVDTFVSIKEEGLLAKFRKLFTNNTIKVYYITLKLNVVSGTGGSHTVFIQLEPDFSLGNWPNNQVRIFCDCPDFKFRSAYILDKRDSLFANDRIKILLGQSLTDAPSKNARTSTLCKHSYAAITWLLQNYRAIMSDL